MKTIVSLFALLLCLSFAMPQANAQEKILRKFENKVKQRADRKIDQAMEKVLDKAEDAAEEAIKKEKEENSSETRPTDAPSSGNSGSETESESMNSSPNIDLSGIMGMGKEMEPLPEGNFSGGSADKGVTGKGPFGVASGMIVTVTKTDNKMMKIHQLDTLYFDDYGNRQVRYQHSEQSVNMMGIKNNESSYTISLMLGDSLFSIDPAKGTGTAMANPASEIYNGMSEQEIEEMAESMAQGMNTKVERRGTDRVQGVVCEVYDANMYNEEGKRMAQVRSWMHKGLVYKSHTRAFGSEITQETTLVKEGVSVNASHFAKRKGISYTTLDVFDKN